MTKFAGLVDPTIVNEKRNTSEIFEYLIDLGVYKFSKYESNSRYDVREASLRDQKTIFYPSNYERFKGSIYRLNSELINELKVYFGKMISSGIQEELFHRKNDFQMELKGFLDEKEKKDHIKNTYKNLIFKLAKEEKFFDGEIFYVRNEKGGKEYFEFMIMFFLDGGISHGDLVFLMNYLQNDPIVSLEEKPRFLDMWQDFEVEYKFAEYLKSFFLESKKLHSIQNLKAGVNRFPEIFVDAYACELFHFCLTKHPKVEKGTFSDFYRIFAAREMIKIYRGSKTRFENFICDNFRSISKLQSNKDKDITQDLEFFESCEVAFKQLN